MGNNLYENGSGGAKIFTKYGSTNTRALYNKVYVALFGGNKEESTTTFKESGELDFSWWGNDRNGDQNEWINSETEKTLQGMTLTSKNQIKAKNAVLSDLRKLSYLGDRKSVV